jgi:hypothetical protein
VDALDALATVAPPVTVQLTNCQLLFAVALIICASPWLTELEPDGTVVPEPLGLAAIVKVRWIFVKFAVTVPSAVNVAVVLPSAELATVAPPVTVQLANW